MSSRFLMVISMLAVLLSGCQIPGGKPPANKEGYFTWVDEQGRVQKTVIPGGESPAKAENGSGSPLAGNTDTQPGTPGKSSGTGHEEFNLENYPDGNALAERGYIRPGDPEPYFTWRDALGNMRVSYYRPDTRTAVEKGEIKPPLKLTEASIYQKSDAPSDASLPEGADALATAVLGLDDSEAPFFSRWTASCCTKLNHSDYVEWEPGREFGVHVTESSPKHEFITGSSHYRLVRLPVGSEVKDFILRLRSFDQKGVFVPSVAFLDAEFRPLRLVTDLVPEFIPESWHRYGHLISYIPVFPARGERWLLIYTTAGDIRDQTVIETRYGPRAIPHQPTGELGLVRIEG